MDYQRKVEQLQAKLAQLMNEETYGALKRIIVEVKEYRRTDCMMKDCILNRVIGGDDIQLVELWIAKL